MTLNFFFYYKKTGNKSDLESKRDIKYEEGKAYADIN